MILVGLMEFHLNSAMMQETSHNRMNIIRYRLGYLPRSDSLNQRKEAKRLVQNQNLDLFQGQGGNYMPIKIHNSVYPVGAWYLSLAGKKN